ncbi:hypothetical protein LCGC14_1098670 [marine sediment metagenome]|uniref:Uncharacterized protein n=1 Tax=marine sediment metagenome TaxID=412755 RepID=A0A0F9PTA9_9ZZZZ
MNMSKTILYVCLGTTSFRETENAVHFAMDLEKGGFSSHFLAFPFGAKFIRQNHLSVEELGVHKKDNYRILSEACQRIKPDWILIADAYYLNFWFGPKHIFDLKWILDNPVAARCATFDHLCLSLKNASLPSFNNPTLEDKFRWLNTTDLTDIMPVMVPCPLGFPTGKSTSRESSVFYYRRYMEQLPWDETKKKNFRKNIGLETEEKLVLFSIARWALLAAQLVTEDLDGWLKHFSRMIEIIFQRVRGKTTLIVVSDYPFFLSSTAGPTRIVNWESIPFDTYGKLMATSDLFITTNAMSTSIAQAVMSKVPTACLISSGRDFRKKKTIPSELLGWFRIAEDRYPDLVRPYLVFPVGWQEILTPLFHQNPVTNTFEFLDMLDPLGAINGINDLLFDSEKKKAVFESQKNYIAQIARLPEPHRIMKSLGESF